MQITAQSLKIEIFNLIHWIRNYFIKKSALGLICHWVFGVPQVS